MKRLLVIDNSNIFLRSYVVNPTLSQNGPPIGGLIGSLLSVQKFVNDIKPDRIIVAWDGEGGSARRRQHDKNYKSNRRPIKLNWDSNIFDSGNEQLDNKIWQMTNLYNFYSCLPINQFLLDGVEADDIIAYVIQMQCFQDWQKIIVSSDRDFIQLLNKNTVLFRPTQKEVLNTKRVVEEFQIHPNNFILARAIVGDKSDNLEGVEGAGIPTMAKRFSILVEEKQYLIKDVLDICHKEIENKSKLKIYKNILDNVNKIEHNYDLMQLTIPKISVQNSQLIQQEIKNKKLIFQKTEFIHLMNKIGFSINLDVFTANANRLIFDT
jgi:DNA polymerase-1